MVLVKTLLPLVFVALVAGCSEAGDEPSGAAALATEESITASSDGFFQVTRVDRRKCAAPLCGGLFVKRVNEATMLCADGTRAAECYVSAVALDGLGLSKHEAADIKRPLESGRVIFKATTITSEVHGTTLGRLEASEVWLGATGSAAEGTFFRVADNGARAHRLNSDEQHGLVDVHLAQTKAPAEPSALSRAANALTTSEGLLVAGSIASPKCRANSDCGPFLTASEFYLRVTSREGKPCGSWEGLDCNDGQFCNWAQKDACGAADAPGKCMYKPETCTKHHEPVCGCDGKTYGNPCAAQAEGTSVASVGPCQSP